MIKTSRVLATVIGIAGLSLVAAQAHADTVTEALSFNYTTPSPGATASTTFPGYYTTDYLVNILIPKFDTSLISAGAPGLESITLTLNTGFETQIVLVNSASSASGGTVRTDVATVLFDDPAGFFQGPDDSTTPPTPPDGSTGDAFYSDGTTSSYRYSLTSGQTKTSPTETGSASNTQVIDNTVAGYSTAFSEFSYNSTTDPTANNLTTEGQTITQTLLSNSGGNTTSTQNTGAIFSGTVTYTYQPTPATPESLSLITGLFCSAGVFGKKRFFRSKSKA